MTGEARSCRDAWLGRVGRGQPRALEPGAGNGAARSDAPANRYGAWEAAASEARTTCIGMTSKRGSPGMRWNLQRR